MCRGRGGLEAHPSHPVTPRSKQSALGLPQEIPGELPLSSVLCRGRPAGRAWGSGAAWAGLAESRLWPSRAGMLPSQSPA